MERKTWSAVIAVKDETNFLRVCLQSCWKLNPDEVIICTDHPAPDNILKVIREVNSKSIVLEVRKNNSYRFHQAWVKRQGLRKARNDRVLVVDVDQSLTKGCLKAIGLVGNGEIGMVSLTKVLYPIGVSRFLRCLFAFIILRLRPTFTGLYAVYKPYWLETEEEDSLKQISDPKYSKSYARGEDGHIHDAMLKRYRVTVLRTIGCFALSDQIEEIPSIQVKIGKVQRKKNVLRMVFQAIAFLRPYLLKGYFAP